jgi:hypothetical protein
MDMLWIRVLTVRRRAVGIIGGGIGMMSSVSVVSTVSTLSGNQR